MTGDSIERVATMHAIRALPKLLERIAEALEKLAELVVGDGDGEDPPGP